MNHLGSKKIETERLIIKFDEEKDLEKLWKYLFNDKNAVEKCDWVDFETKEHAFECIMKSINNVSSNLYFWTIWLKDDNIPIGGISIHHQDDINRTCQIGYSIHPNYWNKGYATEALSAITNFMINEVGYNKVIAICSTSNISSKKVIVKCNYNYVKTNVKSYLHHGKLLDTYEYEYKK